MKPQSSRFTFYSLLLIISAFVVLALIYSVTVPLFEGPDEIWHYAFANHLADGGGLPVFDPAKPATFLRNGAHPPLYYWLIAGLIAPIDRSDFPAEYRFNLANPKITAGAQGTSPNLLIHTAREDFPYRNTALAGHIARLVSIVLGALTIIGVWQVARRLLRNDRLAVVATALVAFIPQFVYGVALINNDALAACAATWLLVALLHTLDDARWRWAWLAGVLLGITLLAKIGMIAVLPIPALVLLLKWWRTRAAQHAVRNTLLSGIVIYGSALIIAGWWYIRNAMLYGDLLAWREWQALVGAGRVPPTPIGFLSDLIGLFGTFWADFSLRVDRILWPVFAVMILIAMIGLIRRALRRDWPALDWLGLLATLVWCGLLVAAAVRYSFDIYDIHGRLLYPALAPIGVLLALGLAGWPRPKWVMGAALALIIAFAGLAPFVLIQPAYARPIVSALPDDVTKISARFDAVELIGYRVKNDRAKTPGSIDVVTYWQKDGAQDAPALHGILTLNQPGGGVIGRAERMLGTDAYPSSMWQPHEIVATEFSVPVTVDRSSVANVFIGTRGESAQLIGSPIDLGRVTVQANRACAIDRQTDVTFGGSIKLIGYRIDESTAPGIAPRIILCWESIEPVPIDYTVFVHVPTAGGVVTADAQPVGGNYPTSAWQPGEQVEDEHLLPATGLQVPQASVGLYRLATGERLPIDGTHDTERVIVK